MKFPMINELKGHYGVTDKLFQIWSHFCFERNILFWFQLIECVALNEVCICQMLMLKKFE